MSAEEQDDLTVAYMAGVESGKDKESVRLEAECAAIRKALQIIAKNSRQTDIRVIADAALSADAGRELYLKSLTHDLVCETLSLPKITASTEVDNAVCVLLERQQFDGNDFLSQVQAELIRRGHDAPAWPADRDDAGPVWSAAEMIGGLLDRLRKAEGELQAFKDENVWLIDTNQQLRAELEQCKKGGQQ